VADWNWRNRMTRQDSTVVGIFSTISTGPMEFDLFGSVVLPVDGRLRAVETNKLSGADICNQKQ
jgi:hypothetical protein